MARHERPSVADLSTKVDHETDEPDDESPTRPDWFKRGQTIGRYLVLECLGVGGMGVIYSAWDPQLDRKLAIKVVRLRQGHAGSARGRIRLQREGQALARLRHPNVIAVHDVGTHEGRVFVAMEFIEGRTLQRWLLRSPRPSAPALISVFLQIGRGLAAAHRAGLVHRDVKPENVMIGDDGRVLVLDFGIAREGLASESDVIEERGSATPVDHPDHPDHPDAPHGAGELAADDDEVLHARPRTSPLTRPLTRSGAVVGTPAYMSPEQHRGRPVDPRGDQFSFCVAMWEALNGEKPYGEGTREKLLARMRLGQIKPFTNRKVPRRVVVSLRRGLAWNPGERFPSMEALLEALNPRGHSAEQRLWFGLGIGSVIGMSIGLLTAFSSMSSRSRSHAQPPHTCAGASDELAAHWNDERASELGHSFRATGLARADASWVRTRERVDDWARRWGEAREQTCVAHFIERRDSAERHDRRVACLGQQRERFADLLASFDEASGAALIDGAVLATVGLPSPDRCAAPGQNHLEPESPAMAQRAAELTSELDRLALSLDLGGGREQLERSRQLATAARELGYPPVVARALTLQAAVLQHSGDQVETEALLREATAIAAAAGDSRTQVDAMIAAVGLISVQGRHAEARRWLELAEATASSITKDIDEHQLRVSLAVSLAMIDRREGLLDAARDRLDAARELLERHGAPQLQLPGVLLELAAVNAELHEDAEAMRLLRRALVLDEQAYGPAHPRVASTRFELARSLEAIGELDPALGEYERALVLFEQIQGSGRDTARVRSHIGALLAGHGRCDQAWAPLVRAVEDARAEAPDSLVLASALEAQAQACVLSHPDALALALEAVEVRERIQGIEHPDLAAPLGVGALALLDMDDPETALALVERAQQLGVHATPNAASGIVNASRGLTLVALRRADEAREPLERAHALLNPASELATRVDQALAALP